jgi:hypothetical protein
LRDEADAKGGKTLESTFAELARSGFANMLDYVRIDADGHPTPDLAALSRDHAAGIAEVRVEHFRDGRGRHARPVERVVIRLNNKTRALAKLAELLQSPHRARGRVPMKSPP